MRAPYLRRSESDIKWLITEGVGERSHRGSFRLVFAPSQIQQHTVEGGEEGES
jgi:hypothetical protein